MIIAIGLLLAFPIVLLITLSCCQMAAENDPCRGGVSVNDARNASIGRR